MAQKKARATTALNRADQIGRGREVHAWQTLRGEVAKTFLRTKENGRRFTPAVFMYRESVLREMCESEALFGFQRDQRIHIRRSPRRTEDSDETGSEENEDYCNEGRRI